MKIKIINESKNFGAKRGGYRKKYQRSPVKPWESKLIYYDRGVTSPELLPGMVRMKAWMTTGYRPKAHQVQKVEWLVQQDVIDLKGNLTHKDHYFVLPFPMVCLDDDADTLEYVDFRMKGFAGMIERKICDDYGNLLLFDARSNEYIPIASKAQQKRWSGATKPNDCEPAWGWKQAMRVPGAKYVKADETGDWGWLAKIQNRKRRLEGLDLVSNDLKQVIQEELTYIMRENSPEMGESEEDRTVMTDDSVPGLLRILASEFDWGIMLLQDFEHADISHDLGQSVAQAIWLKTIGSQDSPEYQDLLSALRRAEGSDFRFEVIEAEEQLDNFMKDSSNNTEELAVLLNMTHGQVTGLKRTLSTVGDFHEFLKNKGIL